MQSSSNGTEPSGVFSFTHTFFHHSQAEYMSTVYHDLQQRLLQAEEEEKNMASISTGKAQDVVEVSSSSPSFEDYFKTHAVNNR